MAFKFVNAVDVHRKIRHVANSYNSFREPLEQISVSSLDAVQRQFDSEGAEITGRWQPLSPRTIASRLSAGYSPGPILNRTGSLKGSFVVGELTNTKMTIVSTSDHFEPHQAGTEKIPQRQILGFSDRMMEQMALYVAAYITKAIDNG